MLPASGHSDKAGGPQPYNGDQGQPGYHQTQAFAQRPVFEPPRPLEPRPTLHTSLSETSGKRRLYDAFRGQPPPAPDYRTQGQSLPGLKDILQVERRGPAHPAHGASWSQQPSASSSRPSSEYFQSSGVWHPPLSLHSSTEITPPYPAVRRVDLPVLESSPVARHTAHSLPVSPYTSYPDARDYSEARRENCMHLSGSSYPGNLNTGSYSASTDDSPDRGNISSTSRAGEGPLAALNAEPQRKYLGVKEVPGEGAYHVYEGGFRIPTQVDGETVNPAWGLTKANKPRKRLALACLDCREKKIKCEPGANSCLQCEKAKRPCRKQVVCAATVTDVLTCARAANLQSTGESTPVPPQWPGAAASPATKGASDPHPQAPQEYEGDAAAKRRSREDPSPPHVSSKKHRSNSPDFTTRAVASNPQRSTAFPSPMPPMPQASSMHKTLMWEEDPINVDRGITIHLLDLYFTHVNGAAYSLFPPNTFMRWVTSDSSKCQLELMTLYAMLAAGSVFADDALSVFGGACAVIAKDAVNTRIGAFNLASVNTRLLLAMYYVAKGADHIAWDYAGSAFRACSSRALQFNTDSGCLDPGAMRHEGTIEFGLSHNQLAECRRRSFWSCFLMDRYDYGRQCSIQLCDIFVRLPCTEESFEKGLPSEAPFLDNGIMDPTQSILTAASQISHIGWLCVLAAIWGDVLDFSDRMVYRAPATFSGDYETFYTDTCNRLQGWQSRLPAHLQYNESNHASSSRNGYAGAFMSMHALYFHLQIRLNRYTQHRSMTAENIKRNIRAAHHHAHSVLRLFDQMRHTPRHEYQHLEGVSPATSAPFVSNMIMAAIDVAGAGGPDSLLRETIDLVRSGLECLQEAARCWNAAKSRLSESQRRYYGIQNILQRPYKAGGGAWLGREWGMKDKLEKEFTWRHDIIYADERADGYDRIYFDALKEEGTQTRSPASGSVRIA